MSGQPPPSDPAATSGADAPLPPEASATVARGPAVTSGGPALGATDPASASAAPDGPPKAATHQLVVPKTRTSYAWVGASCGLLVLLLVIVFIWQNRQDARLNFLWMHGNVPVGLGVLLAFVLGGMVVALIGTARLAQLRLLARRHRNRVPPPD